MASTDPAELTQWLATYRDQNPDPVAVHRLIAAFRDDRGIRVGRPDMKAALRGVPSASAWVTDLDETPVRSDAKDLIERWVSTPAERADVVVSLRAGIEREAKSEAAMIVLNVARALGAIDGPADWSSIQISAWSKPVRAALVEAALRCNQVGLALDALCLGPSPISKADREGFAVNVGEAAPVFAERLSEWARRSATEPVISEALTRLLQLSTAIQDDSIVDALVRVVADAGDGSEKWASTALKQACSRPPALRAALEQLSAEQVAILLVHLTKQPFDIASSRTEVVTQLALTRHCSALSKPSVWRDASVELLGHLTTDTELKVRLMGVAEDSFRSIVDRVARTSPLWWVLSVPVKWPSLGSFVTVEHVALAASRSDASAQLVGLLRERDRQEMVHATDQVSQELARVRSDAEVVRAELRSAREEIAARMNEAEELRQLIAASSENQHSLLQAELNQGRFDVLRAFIDLAEGVRALGSLSDVGVAVETLLRDARSTLENFGVKVRGEPGDLRPADASIDERYTSERMVEVVYPAYLLDDVTVLRRAFVREMGGDPSE